MNGKQKQVTLMQLGRQPIVRAYAFGPQPELEACARMATYLAASGLVTDGDAHRLFGYNTPNPSAGSPNYGYEVVLTGVTAQESAGDLERGTLEGGLYAVLPFDKPDSDYNVTVPTAWQELDAWVAAHGYHQGAQQWLEEHEPVCKLRALWYPLAE